MFMQRNEGLLGLNRDTECIKRPTKNSINERDNMGDEKIYFISLMEKSNPTGKT